MSSLSGKDEFLNIIKPGVRALEAYSVQGKSFHQGLVKLNQNENPFDIPDDIKKEIINEFLRQRWNRYPDVYPTELLKALSEHTQHPIEGIIAGNGSNELMYTIAMATIAKGSKVLIPSPTFFLYEKIVKVFEGEALLELMNDDLSFPTEKIISCALSKHPSVIVLVSPNSPTGQSISVSDVERILRETSALVVVDEAYIEFSDKKSVQSLLSMYDHLIVVRTFSKAFSMAGLRVGYLLAQPQICAELLKPKIPFSVNSFSASVAIKLLNATEIVNERIAYIKNQKTHLLNSLCQTVGVTAFSSDTNFLIFRTAIEGKILFKKLLDRNVLVRDVGSYPMLLNTLRVNVGTEDENKKFLIALNESLEVAP